MTRTEQPVQTDDSPIVAAAEVAMRTALAPSIFNHTMRVSHLAAHLARREPVDADTLAVTALFHDAGTAAENDGEQRFELEGADAAARFLEEWGWAPERVRPVWQAIALHTSAGIAERFGPLAGLLRAAVLVDLGRSQLPSGPTRELEDLLEQYPRLGIEQVLADTI